MAELNGATVPRYIVVCLGLNQQFLTGPCDHSCLKLTSYHFRRIATVAVTALFVVHVELKCTIICLLSWFCYWQTLCFLNQIHNLYRPTGWNYKYKVTSFPQTRKLRKFLFMAESNRPRIRHVSQIGDSSSSGESSIDGESNLCSRLIDERLTSGDAHR